MPSVNFHGNTISSDEIKDALWSFAEFFESDVRVTSGDRGKVLSVGAGSRSLHLHHRAADFHVSGVSDRVAFQQIKMYASTFFRAQIGYEMLWHGPFTETMGEHLHLGVYGAGSRKKYVHFKKEGTTATTKGVYSTVVKMPVLWSARQPYPTQANRDPARLETVLRDLQSK